ncbi:hypothetical protein [Taibaiella chishuiensis]|nr:hypothetical protein [Taibaiella chishuiensis]
MTLNNRPQVLIRCLKQVTVLLIYVSLFVTQLSCIQYCAKESRTMTLSFQALQQHHPKAGKAKVAQVRMDHKTGGQKYMLSPNKRFQPGNGILINHHYPIPDAAIVYIEPARIGHPTAYLLFAVVLARTMRGPPATA